MSEILSFSPQVPFNLPPLPPIPEEPSRIETRAVLKACVDARAALAGLNEAVGKLPNPDVLLSAFVLLEAKDSSEIENIVTTTDKLFQFADHEVERMDSATKETLRYRSALYQGIEMLKTKPLCTALAEAVCSLTKGVEMTVRKVPGTVLKNDRSGQTIYTPPEGEALLRDKLANWERFCHARPEDASLGGDLDPLVRMAILHYQFEAIHPFTDGNGRTGRILNVLFLMEKGLLQAPVLFLSRYLLEHRAAYYAGLLAVTREQAWESWLLYMLAAVRESALWTHRKINALQTQMQWAGEYIKELAPLLYSHELVQTIFTKPYCRISDLMVATAVQRQAASRHLKTLCAIGVLREIELGREKLFLHPNFLAMLSSNTPEALAYSYSADT
jgi:Fic family protein